MSLKLKRLKKKPEEIFETEMSLSQVVYKLGKKLTGKTQKLITVDHDDLISDAIAYYKSSQFDASCPLKTKFSGQPAIDGGGVLRQFYSENGWNYLKAKEVARFLVTVHK